MRRRMHSEEVRTQIAEKENERRKQRQEFFEEGRQLRLETEKEKARLEAIKARKIEVRAFVAARGWEGKLDVRMLGY